eukprot:Skav212784  [mRNA]  locus=scaffold159:267995:288666:- [translate_table: standard]
MLSSKICVQSVYLYCGARGSWLIVAGVAAAILSLSRFWSQEVDFVGQLSRPAPSKVVRCAGDKRLKDRWNSVGKTGKLTDAMRLVASAKVRAAQNGVEKARPFSDELLSMIKGLVKKLKGTGLEADLPMLRVPEKVNNVGILMITAQRGLCGAYNAFVIKKARITDLNNQGIVPKLFIVGQKATLIWHRWTQTPFAHSICGVSVQLQFPAVSTRCAAWCRCLSCDGALRLAEEDEEGQGLPARGCQGLGNRSPAADCLTEGFACLTDEMEARILVLGLDNAGKTTILKTLTSEDITHTMPTQGFNIKSIMQDGFKLSLGSVGVLCVAYFSWRYLWVANGHGQSRTVWEEIYHRRFSPAFILEPFASESGVTQWAQGLVYVVDSSDTRRLEESSRELKALLGEEKLAGDAQPPWCRWPAGGVDGLVDDEALGVGQAREDP